MIIVLNDDPVYLSWIRRHRNGFVLETKRKATKRNTTLHRATCDLIRKSKTKRTHWTTAGRMKACSEDLAELTEWARDQIGSESKKCADCNPTGDALSGASMSAPAAHPHLTKLENDVLSAVIESAVIHLDNELEFRMNIGDVAQYLSKTPSQLAAALRQLVSEQLLEIEGESLDGAPVSPKARVFPTAASLGSVPAFASLTPDELRRELASLHA
jgi:hypothetical protein